MIEYERLLKIAIKMHLWIFLHSGDEQRVYDGLGLTDEENMELGYGGQFVLREKKAEDAPTVDAVERKHGEWVDDGLDAIGAMGIEYRWKKCPNCGERISKAPMQRLPNFCPNCGAEMRKGEEE